ncbi:hypothetical protein SKAU_G00304990 [Synaphobranchus kaupii]|uniref:Lysine-specific metallo-endopeptidase domain-containing protein n=1 Tax=Synaphobranchus kaupii TaxID=118154 RepID=A0A9Q1EQL7_SYNKA|nr:hypothetical protein SKAU_G00304990 [Synaphobranchus kaupii]
MTKVGFKEDEDPKESDSFAYVRPEMDASTVYLCKEFWDAPDHLCKDSKPGTFIHEVSHMLGAEDITHELTEVELRGPGLAAGMVLLGVRGPGHAAGMDEDGECLYREEVAQINANSLEYEFETVLNHQGLTGTAARPRNIPSAEAHPPTITRSKDSPAAGVPKYTKIKNRACKMSYA